ncbi:hypothetical protein AAHE18_04G216200 [Arachis hypogaea]|uniref:Protein kinase domain-containing protein n=1 Tax=Arachis hypogaea TaxID=3818 RepID=A0A445DB75_ARAHY|nr:Receptor-like protein kinase FERONIA [Arachis hypogaea]RYR60430.1 hypothetical protein Ahy_A04g017503 [Arachis hypogaea]
MGYPRNIVVIRYKPPIISFSLLLLLPFLLHSPVVPAQGASSYHPEDDFAVNCGSKETTVYADRKWVGDDDSKLFSTIEQPQTKQPSLITETPYPLSADSFVFSSARIFLSNFTYSFPLKTNGPKFVRLHFYPTNYLNFEPYNSLFSVTAGNFTLLKGFNASRWLANDEMTFFIEYCVNVETGKRLDLTFIPNKSYYAFINGIEVVSMPPYLYYTDPSKSSGFEFVGHGISIYQLESEKALQTLYRINVGEKQIPPQQDTGMYRSWEPDADYIEKQYPSSISMGYPPLKFNGNITPDYTAPDLVYLSARSYGMRETKNYNVTWRFEVDSQFTYMVSLHFCEFAKEIQHYTDRTFQIFIAELLAEDRADVINWSGGNHVPVRRDYAVQLLPDDLGQSSKKVNISIKLQRLPDAELTNYHDVILNGIEIFKISDATNNLAGPNPEHVRTSTQESPQLPQSSKHSKKKIITVIVAVIAVSCLVLASVIGIILFSWRRRSFDYRGGTTKKEGSSSLPSHLCRYFTIAEIRAATNNFDDVFIVGVGGFGNVYKGYIDGGATPVAIKRLKPGSQQGINEFLNEIDMLSQLRHLHLVSLIGYCNDGVEMILVYDFMQRGTLREYLYGSDNKPLPWKQRLEILLGAARGLHYLHAGAKHNIIHRDVKSTNILLDEKWVAKVSDFGLSKVGPTGTSQTHVSTMVKGSLGYLDPEYYKRQRLTLKSDVYSFGVVLLEVLCARPPLIRNVDKHKASLVDWVRKLNDQDKLDQTVDIFLKGSITPECLKWYGQLAMSCLHDDGNQRPSMNDVVGALEFAMQLAEGDKDNSFGGAQDKEKGEESPLIPQFTSDEGSDVLFTSDESGTKDSKVTTISSSSEERAMISGLVFSEIGDPRAR